MHNNRGWNAIAKQARQMDWRAVGGLLILGGGLRAEVAPIPTKIKVSETYRKEEYVRQTGINDSEGQSAAAGKITVNAEWPLDSVEASRFTAETPIAVSAGAFRWQSMLGRDTTFRAGSTSVKIPITASSEDNSKTRNVYGNATLKWERGRALLTLDAQTPFAGQPIAALTALDNLPGDVVVEVPVTLTLGARTVTWKVTVKGRLGRRTAGGGGDHAQVDTLTLRGDSKVPQQETAPVTPK